MFDEAGRVLIARRAAGSHQGGLWEFPGGKLEPPETRYECLIREMLEELGIAVRSAEPLIEVRHRYRDRSVLLDVWWVTNWRGTPLGMERQPIAWVPIEQLEGYDFPAADQPILAKIAALGTRCG